MPDFAETISAIMVFAIMFIAKDIITNIFYKIWLRQADYFAIGRWVRVGYFCGQIEKIHGSFITLKTKEGTLVIPLKNFRENAIEYLEGEPEEKIAKSKK